MNSITRQVFQERYQRIAQLFPFAASNHLIMGAMFALAMYSMLVPMGDVVIWYSLLVAAIAVRYLLLRVLVKYRNHFLPHPNKFDCLFAIGPVLNGLAWSVGLLLAISQQERQSELCALLVCCAVAFHGYSHLTGSKASYIGYFFAVFSMPLYYYTYVDSQPIVTSIILLGLSHFVFFKAHLSARVTSSIIKQFQHEELIGQLRLAEKKLIQASELDTLTNLYQRRVYEKLFSGLLYKAILKNQYLSVTLIDIDHFKLFNDLHGHLTGDKALIEVANVLRTKELNGFVAGRFGGEEFVLLSTCQDRNELEKQLEEIQLLVSRCSIDDIEQPLTISLGTCHAIPNSSSKMVDYIALADSALYQSKRDGRNRSTISQQQL